MAADLADEPRPDQEPALDLSRATSIQPRPRRRCARRSSLAGGRRRRQRRSLRRHRGPGRRQRGQARSARARRDPRRRRFPSIPGTVDRSLPDASRWSSRRAASTTRPTILATEESRVDHRRRATSPTPTASARDDGVNWQVFRPGVALRDPETGEVLGYEAKYVGDARVRRFGNPTTLEITKARQEINRGDRLTPAREAAFPSYMPRAPDKPIKGVDHVGRRRRLGVRPVPDHHDQPRRARRRRGRPRARELPSRRDRRADQRPHDGLRPRSAGCRLGMDSKPVPVVPEPPNAPPQPRRRTGKVVGVLARARRDASRRAQRPRLRLPRLREDVVRAGDARRPARSTWATSCRRRSAYPQLVEKRGFGPFFFCPARQRARDRAPFIGHPPVPRRGSPGHSTASSGDIAWLRLTLLPGCRPRHAAHCCERSARPGRAGADARGRWSRRRARVELLTRGSAADASRCDARWLEAEVITSSRSATRLSARAAQIPIRRRCSTPRARRAARCARVRDRRQPQRDAAGRARCATPSRARFPTRASPS